MTLSGTDPGSATGGLTGGTASETVAETVAETSAPPRVNVPRMIGFGLIGVTGTLPNLAGLWLLTAAGLHYLAAEIVANQFGVLWNFLLIEVLLFRDRRGHRHWADRVTRFALLANADLLLRIPLIALLVTTLRLGALPATAAALLLTFALRYAATETLVYHRRRGERPSSCHG